MQIEYITIPKGQFIIGSTKKQVEEQIRRNPQIDKRLFERQLHQHKIRLPTFEISKYPITNDLFSEFISNTDYQTTAEKEGWGFHFMNGEMKNVQGANWKKPHGDKREFMSGNQPVVMVSWYDTQEFCKWLSNETEVTTRLPTEAEWEKAARGKDGNIWPWGNEWDKTKCNCNDMNGSTTPVGKFSPKGDSPYGCADMAGNVLEWTSTTIGTREPWPSKFKYPYKSTDGRENPNSDARRVARGGTYQRGMDMCLSAFRFADEPENRYSSLGFRVVRERS